MRVAAILIVVFAWACSPADDSDLPPVVWSGEHLDYAPQEHAPPVCRGTLPYMDRYMALAGDAMGIDVGRSTYVLGSDEDPALCPAIGCLHAGTIIYSRRAPHEHELIHAVRAFEGFGYGFFEEGAAEAFGGDDDMNPDRVAAGGSLTEGLAACEGVPLPDRWYPRAGHFFAYLQRYHGTDATTGLLTETTYASTSDDAIAALERVTGMEYADLLDDYAEADPFCDKPQWYRYPLFPCDAPEALRPRCNGDAAIEIEVPLSCDDPSVLGPREGEVFSYVAVDIPADGYYTITAAPRDAGFRGRVELKQCELGCSSRSAVFPYNDLALDWYMPAGRYSVRFTRDAENESPSTLAIKIAGDDCQ